MTNDEELRIYKALQELARSVVANTGDSPYYVARTIEDIATDLTHAELRKSRRPSQQSHSQETQK